MTLLPGSSYSEAMRTLAGLLADIPFTLAGHIPTGKTVTGWRLLIPAEIMEEIFGHAAGPLIGDDEPSAVMLAGMPVNAADGMLVNLADTTENRNYFGTTGTGDGSSPFPQARIVALTARALPRHPRRRHREGLRRGADPAEGPRAGAAGTVRAPGHPLRPELPRP